MGQGNMERREMSGRGRVRGRGHWQYAPDDCYVEESTEVGVRESSCGVLLG